MPVQIPGARQIYVQQGIIAIGVLHKIGENR